MSKSVHIIRVDGTEERASVAHISNVSKLIGADTMDSFNLRDGRVVMVDDTGMIDGKPVNAAATKLYHGICRPGTVHQIHGDVAILVDGEWA